MLTPRLENASPCGPGSNFWERVNWRLAQTGKVPADIAATLAIPEATIRAWGRPGGGDLAMWQAPLLTDCLGCELRWLLAGRGPEAARPTPDQDEIAFLDAMRQCTPADRELLRLLADLLAARAAS